MNDVLNYNSPILRTTSSEVDMDDGYLSTIIDKLEHWVKDNPGVYGISAIQLKEAHRMFMCKIKGSWVLMINPRLIKKFGVQLSLEGCCSVPDYKYMVLRPYSGIVEYQDRSGEVHQCKVRSGDMNVICHEIDHLNGKLIIDKGVRACAKKC